MKGRLILKRKTIALLVTIFIAVLTLSFSLPVFAAPISAPELSVYETDCVNGEKVEVIVRVKNAKGLEGGTFFIIFDSNYLEFESAKSTDEAKLEGIIMEAGKTVDVPVQIGASFIGPDSGIKSNDFDMLRVVFTAKKTGKTKFELDVDNWTVNGESGEDQSRPPL